MRYTHDGVVGEISNLPGTGQICVFHNVFVHQRLGLRGQGRGTAAHADRLRIAKELGYDMVLCVVDDANEAQQAILHRFGWMPGQECSSGKTGHLIRIWTKEL